VKQLAPGVWQLSGFPPNGINVFVLEDVLVDAASRHATRRIMRQISDRTITAHALTHAHPDHQGASHAVCERLGIPFWVGADDADAAENQALIGERQPDSFMAQFFHRVFTGPGHPVDRKLAEGDEVAGFAVLEVPGHSAGHVAYWREADRTLVAGDVFFNVNPLTGRPGLRPPPDGFNDDTEGNRESMRRLAALDPEVVVFGHGPPLRDRGALQRFVAEREG